MMEPLRIAAKLGSEIMMPYTPLAIDALLAYAVVLRDGLAPAMTPDDLVPIDIPVQHSDCGRFHLASFGAFEVEAHTKRFINKRPVVDYAQALATRKAKRIQINAGPDKGYRIPTFTLRLVDDIITWWAVGDAGKVRDLLALIHYLGKKRSVGLGRVVEWTVEPCEPWGEGFPVVDGDGLPLRALPADYESVRDDAPLGYSTLTYPYWDRTKEEPCRLPMPVIA